MHFFFMVNTESSNPNYNKTIYIQKIYTYQIKHRTPEKLQNVARKNQVGIQ